MPTSTEPPRRGPAPSPAYHAAAAAWVALMLLLAARRPGLYESLLQEDHFVEWWTVALFGAAGVLALRLAWRERRAFDGLVGAFCLFVAGEEFSWGQRLLGFTPPEAFLEHNYQQELTLHNFAAVFGEPRWVLIGALTGFGLVLPAVAALRTGRHLLGRVGATVPAPLTSAWVLLAASLLLWYPVTLTGEWVEALAGSVFLMAFAPGPSAVARAAGTGALLAAALALVSGTGPATQAELACARAQTAGIVEDLAYGAGATGRLAGATGVHKRLFTSMEDGYVRPEGLTAYRAAGCDGVPDAAERMEWGVDPWGTAYWIHLDRTDGAIHLAAYSFGPNRRRDGSPGSGAGDDIDATVVITP